MQPYLFPYIGYFQLIAATDQFLYYDDVQFIKRGWIHRNRLLLNGGSSYLTVPCRKGSKYQMINEVEHVLYDPIRCDLLNQVSSYYQKAPFFDNVFPLIQRVLLLESSKIVDMAIKSIKEVCNYLGIEAPGKRTSDTTNNRQLGRQERLIDICVNHGADTYINAAGGKKIYSKNDFIKYDINLKFLKSREFTYPQYDMPFAPWLSIIDVMMFNPIEKIQEFLTLYDLE